MKQHWYCIDCLHRFPVRSKKDAVCPACGSPDIMRRMKRKGFKRKKPKSEPSPEMMKIGMETMMKLAIGQAFMDRIEIEIKKKEKDDKA